MQSRAKDVTTYIQEATPERQAYLVKLRELCLEVLAGYEDVMEYGMPGYKLNGTGEVGFVNQKNHISLYILKEDIEQANRDFGTQPQPVATSETVPPPVVPGAAWGFFRVVSNPSKQP